MPRHSGRLSARRRRVHRPEVRRRGVPLDSRRRALLARRLQHRRVSPRGAGRRHGRLRRRAGRGGRGVQRRRRRLHRGRVPRGRLPPRPDRRAVRAAGRVLRGGVRARERGGRRARLRRGAAVRDRSMRRGRRPMHGRPLPCRSVHPRPGCRCRFVRRREAALREGARLGRARADAHGHGGRRAGQRGATGGSRRHGGARAPHARRRRPRGRRARASPDGTADAPPGTAAAFAETVPQLRARLAFTTSSGRRLRSVPSSRS
jgi:hypothetical protein